MFADAQSRASLMLDPNSDDVFIHHEDLLCNVLTHSTSPDSQKSIVESKEIKGSIPTSVRYDGYSDGQKQAPRGAYFVTHPESDGTVFPWSRYPKRLAEGAPVKILQIGAEVLLDENFKMFYVASTPTQFGAQFQRVYHSHVLAVHKNDRLNIAQAEQHFVAMDKCHNSLFSFEGNQARLATRVVVADKTFPNTVVIAFCEKLCLEPNTVTTIDGVKLSFRDGKVQCPRESCVFQADSMHSLKDHYRNVHLQLRLHKCTDCEKSFSRKLSLMRHIASVHQKAQKPHQCNRCETSCWSASQLSHHISSVHDKERPHECSVCGAAFADTGALNRHTATVHNSDLRHECEHCGKLFGQKSNLKTHVAIVHDRKRSHICVDCNKGFSTLCNLNEHISSVHEKRRLHICPHCSKGFSTGSSRKRHIAKFHECEETG